MPHTVAGPGVHVVKSSCTIIPWLVFPVWDNAYSWWDYDQVQVSYIYHAGVSITMGYYFGSDPGNIDTDHGVTWAAQQLSGVMDIATLRTFFFDYFRAPVSDAGDWYYEGRIHIISINWTI
jgi:hypothetical protein